MGRPHEQGIQFESLTEPFDITDHGGGLFFHIVAAFAQMQRRQISEKTRAGLTVPRWGRSASGAAMRLRAEGKSFDDIAALFEVEAS